MQTLKAGALYFALVFGAGFALGTLRVLFVVPRLGGRNAELIEAPFMLVVTFLAARWTARRLAIVGASAGAPSSMQFALRHPERCTALVLMVPAAYVPRAGGAASLKTPAWTEFLFDTALRSDFLFWAAIRLARETVIGSILATPPEVVEKANADEQARVAQILDHVLPVSPRRKGLVNDAAITSALPRYELERIRTPTLVISVVDDRFGTFDPARYTAEHIPGARFVGYPSGGHVWVGHHKEALDEIAAFLRNAAE